MRGGNGHREGDANKVYEEEGVSFQKGPLCVEKSLERKCDYS